MSKKRTSRLRRTRVIIRKVGNRYVAFDKVTGARIGSSTGDSAGYKRLYRKFVKQRGV